MPHNVFLSYSSKDKATADVVMGALEANGLRCWVAPRDVVPGSDWGESIVEAITSSRLMVVVFSASANDSPQVRREIQRAFERSVPVVPVRVEDVRPGKALEYYISPLHWLDAMPVADHLHKVVATAHQVIGAAEAAKSAAKSSGAGQAEVQLPYATPAPAPRRPVVFAVAAAGGMVLVVLGALTYHWVTRWSDMKNAAARVAQAAAATAPPAGPVVAPAPRPAPRGRRSRKPRRPSARCWTTSSGWTTTSPRSPPSGPCGSRRAATTCGSSGGTPQHSPAL